MVGEQLEDGLSMKGQTQHPLLNPVEQYLEVCSTFS